jgi:hypothetical protein
MKEGQPTLVYKYRTFENANHLRTLITHEIYYPPPLQLNDPFDCGIPFTFWNSPDDNQIRKYLRMIFPSYTGNVPIELQNKSIDELVEWRLAQKPSTRSEQIIDEIISIRKSSGSRAILSIVSDNIKTGELGYTNHLMWSHYSNGHTGFCIEFDTQKLLSSFLQPYEHDTSKMFFKPVRYKKDFPIISPYGSDGSVNIISDDQIDDMLLTKYIKWEYENEWRLVAATPEINPERNVRFDPFAIKGIYLGLSTTDENIHLMKGILKLHPALPKLFLAQYTDGNYEIEFRELAY